LRGVQEAATPFRQDGGMDVQTARDLLATQHRAVLATFRADGTPQLTPVLVGVDNGGHVVISTRETAYKVRNVRRDPRVYLCVFPDQFFGQWIQVDGVAEVVELPQAMDLLVDYYRRVAGEHPDWEDYRAAMVRERRVVLRIQIAQVGPDRHG
jgi:PPOX class probable F420-dependent enzyme